MDSVVAIALTGLLIMSCGSQPKSTTPATKDAAAIKPNDSAAEASKSDKKTSQAESDSESAKGPDLKGALQASIREGNDSKVNRAAQAVLANDPKDVQALNALAVIAIKNSHPQVAKLFLIKAIDVNPNSWELWNNLGICQDALGEDRLSMKALRKAYELNPKDPTIAGNLGSRFLTGKDFKKAQFAMEVVESKSQGRDWKTSNNLGISSAYKGQFGAAQKYYEDALKESPSNKEVLFNLAVLKIRHMNKPNEGLELLQKIRFMGVSGDLKNKVNALETRAKMR